jgi:hypothetical protein
MLTGRMFVPMLLLSCVLSAFVGLRKCCCPMNDSDGLRKIGFRGEHSG